ncbi:unnamed protein product [Prunus armeniaca]
MDGLQQGRRREPSVREEPAEDKVGEAVVKLQTPMWCRSKALRYLSQLSVGSESERFAQSFDAGICASRFGDDTCLGDYVR